MKLLEVPETFARRACEPLGSEPCEVLENFARAELTALERDRHIREWVRLTEAKKQEVAEKQAKLDLDKPKNGSSNRPNLDQFPGRQKEAAARQVVSARQRGISVSPGMIYGGQRSSPT